MPVFRAAAFLALSLAAASAAQAQATVKNDGQFRAALGLGASLASGNTKATNLSLTGDAVRATDQNKLSLYGNMQYARSNGQTTADMRVVDVYRRSSDKLAENWVFIDMLHFLNMQGLDVLAELKSPHSGTIAATS